jgi:hypothetical protein
LVYAALEAAGDFGLSPVSRLDAVFGEPLCTQGVFVLAHEVGKLPHNSCAKFSLECSVGKRSLGLYALEAPIVGRAVDDELELLRGMEISLELRMASVRGYDASRVLTVASSLNKHLLWCLAPSHDHGPWIMARYIINWNAGGMAQGGELVVRNQSLIGGGIARSLIEIDGTAFGELWFARSVGR